MQTVIVSLRDSPHTVGTESSCWPSGSVHGTGMLAIKGSKHVILLSTSYSALVFFLFFRLGLGSGLVLIVFPDHDFVFFMKTTIDCCLIEWH